MQPIIAMHSQLWLRSEAFLRVHDHGRPITIVDFLARAEAGGRMTAVDQWVIAQGLDWLEATEGQLGRGRLHLNTHAGSWDNPEFLAWLLAYCATSPARQWLCIEITEQAPIENKGRAVAYVRQLRAAGVEIALDDFGSSHMGLDMLFRFPADMLKIDAEVINTLCTQHVGRALLATVIAIARKRGMAVTAEGVETQETLDNLKALGVDYVQGFFYAKPLAPEETIQTFSMVANAAYGSGAALPVAA